jgi:hypothetical protein
MMEGWQLIQENSILKKQMQRFGKISIIALAILSGFFVGRMHSPLSTVHAQDNAQDNVMGASTCTAIVPTSWGDFKGGSSYGLAFEDSQGRIRFVLNPPCGGAIVNATQEPPSAYVSLYLQRK